MPADRCGCGMSVMNRHVCTHPPLWRCHYRTCCSMICLTEYSGHHLHYHPPQLWLQQLSPSRLLMMPLDEVAVAALSSLLLPLLWWLPSYQLTVAVLVRLRDRGQGNCIANVASPLLSCTAYKLQTLYASWLSYLLCLAWSAFVQAVGEYRGQSA